MCIFRLLCLACFYWDCGHLTVSLPREPAVKSDPSLADHKLIPPMKMFFFRIKGTYDVFIFSFQGFTELLPIDLIKIFDENELEVCVLTMIFLYNVDDFKYLLILQMMVLYSLTHGILNALLGQSSNPGRLATVAAK